VAHVCDETKFSNLSAEKCLTEEVAQEIQTIFRPQTVLNDRCRSQAFPNDNAQDIYRKLVLKLGFCINVWLAAGPVFKRTSSTVFANTIEKKFGVQLSSFC
jgi:hypothetical protein